MNPGQPSLHIKVLGELTVVRDDREVVMPASKKTRALLAYLAVVKRRQRRDHLCRMFWPTPDDPRASLRWSLSKLRPVLDHGAGDSSLIRADRDSVALDTDRLEVDLFDVTRFSGKDLRSLETGELERLASTFRGGFLEGLDLPRCPVFVAWRNFHGDALERTRRVILRTLVERLRSHPGRAFGYVEALKSMAGADTLQDVVPEQNFEDSPDEPAARGDREQSQRISYCRSRDGVRIAYAVSGRGPPILRAAHWMSHLQYEWESPVWRHWIDALSNGNTLVRYDERGNGLSDWDAADLSISAMVSDLESVADACGLDVFPLLGVSQSCAVSVAYVARNPGRVSHLILYGGFAKGWRKRDDPHAIATHEAMTTLIREGWGKDNPAFRQMFTETFIPGASREQMAWFNDLQKKTASPESASRLHEAFGNFDVSTILAEVRVPTLVLHARKDEAVPFEEGRTLAAAIPGASFIDLNSSNHILLGDEPAFDDLMHEIRSFIKTPVARPIGR